MSRVNHTPWTGRTAISNANLNTTHDELDTGIENVKSGASAMRNIVVDDATELTIVSGAVTVTQFLHTIDTEDDASGDNLTDINGGQQGQMLMIRSANSARDITVIHNASKIYLNNEANWTLTDNQMSLTLIHDGTRWNEVGRADTVIGESNPSYARIYDLKTTGTNGGDAGATTSWETRDLNTEASDSDGIVTLSANQFTLGSGTYRIRAVAPACDCNGHRAKLRNTTTSADVLLGTSAYSYSSDLGNHASVIVGTFTIVGTHVFEIQHYIENSAAGGYDWGYRSNDGNGEIYTVVEIWKYP